MCKNLLLGYLFHSVLFKCKCAGEAVSVTLAKVISQSSPSMQGGPEIQASQVELALMVLPENSGCAV